MIWRTIFYYLIKNEQLINKLANSKPIRLPARWLSSLMIRMGMSIGGSSHTAEEFIKHLRNMAEYFKKKIEPPQEGTKRKPPT